MFSLTTNPPGVYANLEHHSKEMDHFLKLNIIPFEANKAHHCLVYVVTCILIRICNDAPEKTIYPCHHIFIDIALQL